MAAGPPEGPNYELEERAMLLFYKSPVTGYKTTAGSAPRTGRHTTNNGQNHTSRDVGQRPSHLREAPRNITPLPCHSAASFPCTQPPGLPERSVGVLLGHGQEVGDINGPLF